MSFDLEEQTFTRSAQDASYVLIEIADVYES